MQKTPHAAEAAKRIVDIQTQLSAHMEADFRDKLTAEQRRLWSRSFPGTPYEEIAATAH